MTTSSSISQVGDEMMVSVIQSISKGMKIKLHLIDQSGIGMCLEFLSIDPV
jgi:hypothetical protein